MESFDKTAPKTKSVELSHWLAVLPATVLAGYIVSMIAGVITSPIASYRMLNVCLTHFPTAAAAVIAGGVTAPKHQIAASIVVTLVWTLLSLTMHVLLHPNPHFLDYMAVVAAGAGSAGGIAFVCYRNGKERGKAAQQDVRGD